MRICLVALLSFILLNSCLKKQDLDSVDLGPALNPDEVQSKMYTAVGGYYVEDIRKNEMSTISSAQIIEDNQVVKDFQQDIIVNDFKETADRINVDLLFNRRDFNNSANSLSNQPFNFFVDKVSSLKSEPSAQAQAETPQPFFLFLEYSYYSKICKNEGINCYNLTTTDSKLYVPPEKANPTVCPDINDCLVNTTIIQFDLLDQKNLKPSGRPVRQHFTFIVSTQVPFFSKVLKLCRRGLATSKDREVVVEDCYSVTDFSYGQDP